MKASDARELSVQSIKRMPYYLKMLMELEEDNVAFVPASAIAEALGIYQVQVRKDLAAVSSQPGKPRVGFCVRGLVADIKHYLGYDNANAAVLVGAGHLGKALLSYGEFQHFGLRIAAAFDINPDLDGTTVNNCPVYSMDKLPDICREGKIPIGIITTPAAHAQEACDELVDAGCRAIWNFAHVHLHVPDDILVQNEDMAVSFALLSSRLAQDLRQE